MIEPHTDPRLGSVSCEVETAAGTYKTGWKYEENGKVSFYAEIPFDAEAENPPSGPGAENGRSRKLII